MCNLGVGDKIARQIQSCLLGVNLQLYNLE
jgi:hypothetical protein